MDSSPSSPVSPAPTSPPHIVFKPDDAGDSSPPPQMLHQHQPQQQQQAQQQQQQQLHHQQQHQQQQQQQQHQQQQPQHGMLLQQPQRKCIHHRPAHCGRPGIRQLMQQQQELQQAVAQLHQQRLQQQQQQQQQQLQQHHQQSSTISSAHQQQAANNRPAASASSSSQMMLGRLQLQQQQHQQQHQHQQHQLRLHQSQQQQHQQQLGPAPSAFTSRPQPSHPYSRPQSTHHHHPAMASTSSGSSSASTSASPSPPQPTASSSAAAAAAASPIVTHSHIPIVQPGAPNGTVVTTIAAPAPQSGPVGIQCQPGLVQQLNAALLADRYLLLDLIDGSSLYKCFDVQTQQQLVCKVVNNPCINLWRAHFRLNGHPHVNDVQHFIQGPKQSYLFFSQSQGDLHSYVRLRKRLRESEARRLFRQMCEVVKSCHEQGIVLRDLKLRKFVFADADRTHLRLESLEDAVILENPDEDAMQDKRGCPAYVSPEILRVNTTYSGKAADMWSLGVILYTMLVGRYPFNDSEHATLFVKISRGQFQIPDCLSSKARCMIRSLLRREPTERIASEDLLLHPWMKHDDSRDHSPPSSSSGGFPRSTSAAVIAYQRSLSAASDQCVPECPAFDGDSDEEDGGSGGAAEDAALSY